MPIIKNLGTNFRLLITTLMVFPASGCVETPHPEAIIPELNPTLMIAPTSPLHDAVGIGSISHEKEDKPLFGSGPNVKSEDFRTALEESLKLNTLLANKTPRLVVNVDLLELGKLRIGLDQTADVAIRYVVLRTDNGESPLMDEVILASCTRTFHDEFDGSIRYRLAEACALKSTIDSFLSKLITIDRRRLAD